jgi:NADP-dependent aldehyde dehydrogenase
MSKSQVLIDGTWRESSGTKTFQAVNPATREPIPGDFPVSPWNEIEQAIQAAARVSRELSAAPGELFAKFLDRFADRIEARAAEFISTANQETALPVEPRLKVAELPRTTNQLRQAAAAAREGSWSLPTIDTKNNIRSRLAAIGPVVVFGPNNFPFAFNSAAGGDFAAAVAAGNPVIAKGHSSHPHTTRLFAEEAFEAVREVGLPPAFVQLIYRTEHTDGCRLVSHPAIGASGYTGARGTGLVLKEAADRAGKPIYLELSSINPVCVLPGALAERGAELATEFTGSCLMGSGQFCTNPGLVLLLKGPDTESFIDAVRGKFESAPVGTMLSEGVLKHFESGIAALVRAGAELVTGGQPGGGKGVSFANTLLRVTGSRFLENSAALQTEAFGNSSLLVVADDEAQLLAILDRLEGNLTGTIYSAKDGSDERLYSRIEPVLRRRVGRLINDKMPTGVAVSPAMNHGGPFPATGHPGFTAVGIPASIRRFAMLQCYDGVRPHRLPPELQDQNPRPGSLWRYIDGQWTHGDVG